MTSFDNGVDFAGFCRCYRFIFNSHQAILYIFEGTNLTRVLPTAFIIGYLHIMNVAIKPAVESAELRSNQDERFGNLSSFQESVQVIHHPGRQPHSSVPAQNQCLQRNGAKRRVI